MDRDVCFAQFEDAIDGTDCGSWNGFKGGGQMRKSNSSQPIAYVIDLKMGDQTIFPLPSATKIAK